MNKSIYERCSLRDVSIFGFGYKTDKQILYNLKLNDATVDEKSREALFGQILIDARPLEYSLQQYSILDMMVDNRVMTPYPYFDEQKLIFDKNNTRI
ncbi:MAG: hypothetical protein GX045_08770 [Clostridiaceae bacterium]|nr:hypothetical protein [Clostridiaceae bacterium]